MCAQSLAQAGVPQIKTLLSLPGSNAETVVEQMFTDNVVIKPLVGHSGMGVTHATGLSDLLRVLSDQDKPFIIQPYTPTAAGVDLRMLVVGEKVLYALERTGAVGDFRANIGLGGTGKVVQANPGQIRIALAAARACELDFAGVDLTVDPKNPQVIEVNTNAGLGSLKLTGDDTALAMARHVQTLVERSS